MEKGDVGMAKCFTKKYGTRDELSTTCNPKVMSRCLSAPDATSLHHCLQSHHQYCTILSWIQALDTKRPVVNLGKGDFLGICHLLSIQQVQCFYSLMGGMVSHMQVLVTPSSTVNNTKYLDPYHRNHSLLPWGSDVGMYHQALTGILT